VGLDHLVARLLAGVGVDAEGADPQNPRDGPVQGPRDRDLVELAD
jgi:hypothetical protein